jgi:hypothetical protein
MKIHKEIKERIDNLELTYVAVENPLAKIKELEERIKNLTDSVHELERFVHTRTRNMLDTFYGRLRYVYKKGTSSEVVLQQEQIKFLPNGEIERNLISIPLDFESK